jgi:hypothetical protein
MAIDQSRTGLENELSQALGELQTALGQASTATATIQSILPKIGAIGSLFDELDAVIRSGRQQIGSQAGDTPTTYTRPTLVVPSAPQPAPQPFIAPEPQPEPAFATSAPAATIEPSTTASGGIERETPESVKRAEAQGLVCFRLEFESRPGPLDLRTVDDAVSEHPAVRDVALLDYDGRKATLKVWIDGSASPSDVQSTLVERSSQLFAAGNDVTIVALEDVA